MARSYRRPWIKDKCRKNQRLAARTFRRNRLKWDVADGMSYKRYWEMWSISDWIWEVRHPEERGRSCASPELDRWYRERFPDRHAREVRRYIMHIGNRRAHRARVKDLRSATEVMLRTGPPRY